jgi:hypothetical protein
MVCQVYNCLFIGGNLSNGQVGIRPNHVYTCRDVQFLLTFLRVVCVSCIVRDWLGTSLPKQYAITKQPKHS